MSCRTTPYGSAYTTLARLDSGLSDVQTLSLFHTIRREFRSTSTPFVSANWHTFIDRTIETTREDDTLTDARRRAIVARLERARDGESPDTASFVAIQTIGARARAQAQSLDHAFNDVANRLGVDASEVRNRFDTYAAASRSSDHEYVETSQTFIDECQRNNLPVDSGSVYALNRLRQEAAAHETTMAGQAPQRITRTPFNSTAVSEAGYDPAGGRLEVVMNSSDRVYMYRNVSADVWNRMNTGSAGRVFATEIRGNGAYSYTNREEAERDGVARRCSGCGQFCTVGHSCPPVAVAAAPTADVGTPSSPVTEPVVEVSAVAAPDPAMDTPVTETPEPVTEARPVVNIPNPCPWGNRRTTVRVRNQVMALPPTQRSEGALSRYSYYSLPNLTNLRSEARNSEVHTSFTISGIHNADESYYRSNAVSGDIAVRRDGNDWTIETSNLRCSCREYQQNYDCQHLRTGEQTVRALIIPSRSAPTPVDVEAAQQSAEAAIAADWSRTEEGRGEAEKTWASDNETSNYSTNFDAFEKDISAARERIATGEHPIPYMRENVLDGACAEGSKEGFGVELEFVLPRGVNKQELNQAIAADLYAAGLTKYDRQMGYHQGARDISRTHQGGWRFERDCTVDGEIISPIMQDTPETWDTINKVCNIIKQHGGKASAKTGSHVHVSAPNLTGGAAAHLVHAVNQHEDVIYRLSSNPEKPQHRRLQWCNPNRAISEQVVDFAAVRATTSHSSGLNLAHTSGGDNDHPEFRHWDGTLDPNVIQAQAKLSVAMAFAAKRLDGQPVTRKKEPVGSHHKRLFAIRGRSRRALTSDELRDDSATTRSFIDTLFKRPEDKAQIASLFHITKWASAA